MLGAAIGVLAAGAAAGVAVERMTVGRGIRRKARLALDAAGPYGTLRGEPGTTRAEDGTELYYEVEEAAAPAGNGAAPLTVVFSHGYCLNQDSWHFQRLALRGLVRAVYWDQRSHGRSGRGAAQRAGEAATIDQLGRDLKAVIDAAAPHGPLVLAGHSMGGMTVMALAEQFPELIAERVAGVFFAGTSAGKLAAVTLGLPAAGAKAFRVLAPGVLRALGSQAALVERGRRATADLFAGIVKRYSFASEVDPGVARLAERMIESTPIDVVAEFYPAFTEHEKIEALVVLDGLPALVVAGDKDLLTPLEHSEAIVEKLPGARLVVVPEAGHLALLEYPELVNAELAALLVEAAGTVGAPLPEAVRELARHDGTGGTDDDPAADAPAEGR
nr:alpha/beta hydrolase [Streptomyces sp. SID5468]